MSDGVKKKMGIEPKDVFVCEEVEDHKQLRRVVALWQRYWPFPLISSHHGQTSPPPLPKALPHLTRVTSQPTLVTEEMNLSFCVSPL